MPIPLRVLNVEDSGDDAVLLRRYLARSGYDVVLERVATAGELEAALRSARWDVAVVDYVLPGFDGRAALAMLGKLAPDLPVVVVSGAVSEEVLAGQAVRPGVHDYLAKTYLSKLVPAIGLAAGAIAEVERPDAHLTLCKEYLQLPEPHLSKAAFHGEQAVLTADPRRAPALWASALVTLGGCYLRMGRPADAARTLMRFLEADLRLDEADAMLEGEVHLQLGLAQEELGDLEGAAAQLQEARMGFERLGLAIRAEECAHHQRRLVMGHSDSDEGAALGRGAVERHLEHAELHLALGDSVAAVREGIAALQQAGEDSAKCFACYGLLMRCALHEGHRWDALSFALSAHMMALEAEREELVNRSTAALTTLFDELGDEGPEALAHLEQEYARQGLDIAPFLPEPMRSAGGRDRQRPV